MTRFYFKQVGKDKKLLTEAATIAADNKATLGLLGASKKQVVAAVIDKAACNPWFLACQLKGETKGFFIIEEVDPGEFCSVHIFFKKGNWRIALEAARDIDSYLFSPEGLNVKTVCAPILEDNILTQKLVRELSYKLEAIEKNAIVVKGKPLDRYLFVKEA